MLQFLLVSAALSAAPMDDLITFEVTPFGDTPIDNAPLTQPYDVSIGQVRLFFDVDRNMAFTPGVDQFPEFERTGPNDDERGFFNSILGEDDLPNGGNLGTWFIRQPVSNEIPPPLVVEYLTASSLDAVSGEIWDIDFSSSQKAFEQWRVDVIGDDGTVVATSDSPEGLPPGFPRALDGLPWTFSFAGLSDEPVPARVLRITFIGTTGTAGLAFNNFNATAPSCLPDVDGNGLVEFDDLLAVLGAWGDCFGCDEDIDSTGVVDFSDLLLVLSAWGPC